MPPEPRYAGSAGGTLKKPRPRHAAPDQRSFVRLVRAQNLALDSLLQRVAEARRAWSDYRHAQRGPFGHPSVFHGPATSELVRSVLDGVRTAAGSALGAVGRPDWRRTLESYLTHAQVDPTEWRLHQAWYDALPWAFREGGAVPRRDHLDERFLGRGVIFDPQRGFESLPYGLFPRGMQRTLFGTYVLRVLAHVELTDASGPEPFARLDEARAAAALERARFPGSLAQQRIRDDPVGALHDRVLNGVHPFAFGDSGGTKIELRWGLEGRHGHRGVGRLGETLLVPDLDARFELTPAGPRLTSITVLEGATRIDAGDGEQLKQAILALRSGLLLAAEVDVHLVGHFLAEDLQVALHVALLEGDPLRELLASHVDGADVINLAGDWLVVGEQGILPLLSGIPSEVLVQRIAWGLAGLWRTAPTFAPRASLGTDDRYAEAAAVVWEALGTYAEAAIPTQAGPMLDSARRLSSELRRWTHEGTTPAPELSTRADLVQFVRFVLFQVTFLHAWVNDAQWDDGGDPEHTPFALRALPDDRSYADWLASVAPSRVDVGFQKIVGNVLSRFDVGLALKDDLVPRVPERFRDLVRDLGPPFSESATDRRLHPSWFRSRLNA